MRQSSLKEFSTVQQDLSSLKNVDFKWELCMTVDMITSTISCLAYSKSTCVCSWKICQMWNIVKNNRSSKPSTGRHTDTESLLLLILLKQLTHKYYSKVAGQFQWEVFRGDVFDTFSIWLCYHCCCSSWATLSCTIVHTVYQGVLKCVQPGNLWCCFLVKLHV